MNTGKWLVNGDRPQGVESNVEVPEKRLALDIGGLICVGRGRRGKGDFWRVTSMCEGGAWRGAHDFPVQCLLFFFFLFPLCSPSLLCLSSPKVSANYPLASLAIHLQHMDCDSYLGIQAPSLMLSL